MSEELALAPRHLSGTQKSAILMLLLGEDEAADLLKHMGPREVQNLGQAMYSVADVDQDTVNVVLDEFILAAREQTSLGLGTGPYVKNVFVKALGEEKAGSVLGRMSSSSPQKGIEILDWMDARSIAATISSEHPQVIAAVLCHLEPGLAAEVLQLLTDLKIVREESNGMLTWTHHYPSVMQTLDSLAAEWDGDYIAEQRAAAATLGRAGGRVTSDAKAADARENGKRGGRPRKQTNQQEKANMARKSAKQRITQMLSEVYDPADVSAAYIFRGYSADSDGGGWHIRWFGDQRDTFLGESVDLVEDYLYQVMEDRKERE